MERYENPRSTELRGKTFKQVSAFIGSKELLLDCYFCKKRKVCRNPNSKTHKAPPTLESVFYTCAVYEYGPAVNKPKPKPPYFNPERIASLNWALEATA
jgi:hypothetical protein